MAIFDLVHDLESLNHRLKIFSEIRVIPGDLQLHEHHSQFQIEFQMLVAVSIVRLWPSHRALGHTSHHQSKTI